MDNKKIKKILNFLRSHPTLESVNAVIGEAEREAMKKIEDVKSYANQQMINVSIDEKEVIAHYIENVTGISRLYPAYVHKFEKYTAMCSGWHILFYAVRDSIWDYHHYLSGAISKDGTQIKMIKIRFEDESEYVCKEFENGKVLYRYEWELRERVELVLEIARYFKERGL
jgi:hypothetical protein